MFFSYMVSPVFPFFFKTTCISYLTLVNRIMNIHKWLLLNSHRDSGYYICWVFFFRLHCNHGIIDNFGGCTCRPCWTGEKCDIPGNVVYLLDKHTYT